MAQGRARVSGWRLYGWKSLGSEANWTVMPGISSTLGIRQGSAPLARYPSERTITGTIYFKTMRLASKAIQKQSAGGGAAAARNGSFGVAAEERLKKIGLLSLGWQSGGRSTTLDVTNHERQFGHDCETKRLGFQRHSWAGSGRDCELAGVGSADRRSDGSNFVFCLEGQDTEILVLRQFVNNAGSRGNGVAAEEKLQSRFVGRGNESEGEGLIPTEIAVDTWAELRRRNFVAGLEDFGGFAVGVASFEGELVGLGEQRLLFELVVDPADRRLHRAVVEPVAHAECEKVLAAVHGFRIEAQGVQGRPSETLEFDREDTKLVQSMVFERIRRQVGLAEIGLLEAVGVHDEDSVGFQITDVDLQRRRVHCNQ